MQPSAIFDPSPLSELRVVRGMLVFNMVFFAIVRTDSERTLTVCANVTGNIAALQPLEFVDLPFGLAGGLVWKLHNGC